MHNITRYLRPHSFLLCVFLALVALPIMAHTLNHHSRMLTFNNQRGSILAMYRGDSQRPYIYRALVPKMAQGIDCVTPQSVKEVVAPLILHGLFSSVKKPFNESLFQEYLYPIAVMLLIAYVSLIAYGLALYQLAGTIKTGWKFQFATCMLGMAILLPFVGPYPKIYDFPALALSAFCLLALFQKKWLHYLVFFMLGCLNHEAILFQTMLFALFYWDKMDKKEFMKLLLAQGIIFVAIIGTLHSVYADNAGFMMRTLEPSLMVYAVHMLASNAVVWVTAIGMLALLIYRWKTIPSLLCRAQWIVPANLGLYLIFGWPGEYRVLLHSLPAVALLLGFLLFSSAEIRPPSHRRN